MMSRLQFCHRPIRIGTSILDVHFHIQVEVILRHSCSATWILGPDSIHFGSSSRCWVEGGGGAGPVNSYPEDHRRRPLRSAALHGMARNINQYEIRTALIRFRLIGIEFRPLLARFC